VTVHNTPDGLRLGGLSSGLSVEIIIYDCDGVKQFAVKSDILPLADQADIDSFVKWYMEPIAHQVFRCPVKEGA
jgi:hypothetical protein